MEFPLSFIPIGTQHTGDFMHWTNFCKLSCSLNHSAIPWTLANNLTKQNYKPKTQPIYVVIFFINNWRITKKQRQIVLFSIWTVVHSSMRIFLLTVLWRCYEKIRRWTDHNPTILDRESTKNWRGIDGDLTSYVKSQSNHGQCTVQSPSFHSQITV